MKYRNEDISDLLKRHKVTITAIPITLLQIMLCITDGTASAFRIFEIRDEIGR